MRHFVVFAVLRMLKASTTSHTGMEHSTLGLDQVLMGGTVSKQHKSYWDRTVYIGVGPGAHGRYRI